jgi:hypothetical protein
VARSLLVVALAAAILVPAAAASGTPRVKLALVPLPKAALGAQAMATHLDASITG